MGLKNGNNSQRLALVIGSGSVKCAAALGLWKALKRAGIEIDMYVGCSGGSIYSGVMALDYDPDDCIEMTLNLWDRRLARKLNWPSILRMIMPNAFGFNENFGLIDDQRLWDCLYSIFEERTFADTVKSLKIMATDFNTDEQVVLTEGSVVNAVRASSSIPFIWPPWKIGERMLVDGAFLHAIGLRAQCGKFMK